MSRGIDSTAKTEMQNDSIKAAIFLKLGDGGDLKLWTGYGDKTISADTYTGAGDMLQIGQVTEEVGIVGTTLSITLTGLNSTINTFVLGTDAQGEAVQVDIGVLDDNGDVVGALVNIFTGYIDSAALTSGAEDSSIAIVCGHALNKFNKTGVSYYSDADQQARHPGDLFFEYLTDTVGSFFTFGPTS